MPIPRKRKHATAFFFGNQKYKKFYSKKNLIYVPLHGDCALWYKGWRNQRQEHGSTLEQTRKSKTAISAWSFHDLQDQASLSDWYQFKLVVVKEIKHKMATEQQRKKN